MSIITCLFEFDVSAARRASLPLLALAVGACGSNTEPQITIVQDDAGGEAAPSDGGLDVAPDAGDPGGPPKCVATGGGTTAPTARDDSAGALDATGKQLLVFGGDTDATACGASPTPAHVGDTWLLDVGCGTFKQVDGTGPSARARHAITEDRTATGAGRALLFGGRTRPAGGTGAFTPLNDVWSFDFATTSWSELATTGTKPTPRYDTSIAVSAKRSKLYLFGGNVSTSALTFSPRSDTFVLDLATKTWAGVGDPAGAKPQPRELHAVALDDDAGVLYLHSGADERASTGPFFDDLWALDLETEAWSEITTHGDPPLGRIAHHMEFDRATKHLVIFGGHDDGDVGNQNDVWTIDPTAASPTWTKLALGDALSKKGTGACTLPADFTTIDKRSPERRASFVFGARADGQGFYVYGGKSDCGLLADGWWFSAASSSWTQTLKSPVGLSCLRYSTTCSALCG